MEEYLERFVPLIKPSKGFKELKSLVIDSELCSTCGTCSAFCDRIRISSIPELVEPCTLEQGSIRCGKEGTCYDNCPFITANFLGIAPLGKYLKIMAVRSRISEILDKAQDGGAASALALFSLEKGFADLVIGVGRDREWRAIAKAARNRKELLEMLGTKYSKVPLVEKFGEILREKPAKVLVIGVGCQIEGIRNIQKNLLKDIPVELTLLGLFCFENFPYQCLKEKIEREFDLKIDRVWKMDISKGKFVVKTEKEILKKPVRLFDTCVNDACKLCTNFTSLFSDISIGSIGSKPGWSTVIVRNKKGEKLIKGAAKQGYIETSAEVDVAEVEKVAMLKLDKSKALAHRRLERGLYLPGESNGGT